MRLLSLTAPVLFAVLLAGVAGCGSDSAGAADTQLEVTFWPEGRSKGDAEKLTLTCDPPGGSHQNPEAACEQLYALDNPFAPPAADEICTELYGGPEQALITGTYRGEPVSYKLARTNGCEIDRYQKRSFLLPLGIH